MKADIPKIEKEIVGKRKFYNRVVEVNYFLLFTTLAFLFLAIISRGIPYFQFDLVITQAIQRINNPVFNELMLRLTNLGDPYTASIAVIIISGVLLLLRKRVVALLTIISTLGASGIGAFFKNIIARPRPSSSLINQIGHFVKPDSFPSGHVLYFMGLYGFLFVFVFSKFKKSPIRTVILSILIFLLVGIGFSRIDLGAHWFSDVLGSYLIGFVWLYFMTFIYNKYEKKSPKK